jgi:ABC-type uncharacterized transport system ATPase subunit
MAEVILQTQGLTKRFGRRTAVDNLTLHVEQGDIYGFSVRMEQASQLHSGCSSV